MLSVIQQRAYMLNGRGKTRSMRAILTYKLVKFLPIFKDPNYESKKKEFDEPKFGGLQPAK